MLIAETTLSDGIAIVVFATAIFLFFFGIFSLVKWLFRSISGNPNPAKLETVLVVLELPEDGDEQEAREKVDNFIWYLQPKLAAEKAGYFHTALIGANEVFLQFRGIEAEGIWNLLGPELTNHSPCKPLRVTLDRAEIHGGQRTIDPISWRPGSDMGFQIPPKPEIPKHWLLLSRVARALTAFGGLGISVWEVIQKSKGMSENEFSNTGLGTALAYLSGTTLVGGLSLGVLSSRRIQAVQKDAGFPCNDSSLSTTLKYVLLTVIAIFGLLLLVT